MREGRILVAGIGNVFLGDDGFGVEVVARLRERPHAADVEIADFGIRGFDLAYALMEDYEAAILIDALPLGKKPGTVHIIEPEVDGLGGGAFIDSHAMNPVEVFKHVKQLGGTLPRTLIVGCEPASFGSDEGRMSLSRPVRAAVSKAVDAVETLLQRLSQKEEVA
ncbi:MAG: hydrogenase maturation protease [Candidatus Dormibacteraeota bacterium]|nr:hydrogenase maturation protease [Candidatus Dormibacteraeota bacterium]